MKYNTPIYLQWAFAMRTNNGSLRNWKRQNNRITFSCPICGDSATDKNKARGNIYEYKNTLMYGCYNGCDSMSFSNFLKQVNEPLYKEFKLAVLSANNVNVHEPSKSFTFKKDGFYPVDSKAEKTLKNQLSKKDWRTVFVKCKGEAANYIESRKIPNAQDILWTDNFRSSIIDLYEMYNLDIDDMSPCRDEPKIIFPFLYDNILTYVQGRSIDPTVDKKYRYMTLEVNGGHKVYGHENVKDGDVYVTEGPIDSKFVSNGISVADANLTRANQVYDKERLVLIYDNEPRSKIGVGKMEGALKTGHRIVILPHEVEEKDLNLMYLAGRDVQRLVEQYQFKGPAGLLRLKQWARV